MFEYLVFTAGLIALSAGLFLYWDASRLKTKLNKEAQKAKEEFHHRAYELAILKEMGERIGYSLNIQNILEIITGSLHQFIEYNVVSYMLLEPEKILFRVHLEKSVHRKFIDEIRNRMLSSLSALLDREFKLDQVEEIISGAILLEEMEEPVNSFFNIPLVIGERVVGVLTIAHTAPGHYKEEEMTILYKIIRQASHAVSKLQEVVENEQRKLNAMVQSMAEGVIMTDRDYRVVVANPAARQAVGLPQNKQINIFDFIDILGGKFDIRGRLEESIKLDKSIEIPEVILGDRIFQVLVSPVKISSGVSRGDVVGGVVILHDITHDKEVEKLHEDFTSMVVHELRSPIDGIRKRIEVIRDMPNSSKDPKSIEMSKDIYKNASQILEMINDLLDVAKIESGKFELQPQASDIRSIIQERVHFFELLAQDSGIKIGSVFDANLPATVICDPLRIGQALNNLISNGIKFTETGGSITIQALLHRHGRSIIEEAKNSGIQWHITEDEKNISENPDAAVIAVTDTGVGIPKLALGHLFNKFVQFRETAARKEKRGTGLGLVIAKGIIEEHGGIIGLASKEGVGTTAYFTIPIK